MMTRASCRSTTLPIVLLFMFLSYSDAFSFRPIRNMIRMQRAEDTVGGDINDIPNQTEFDR